jgi:hypothetical protein
MIRSPLFGIVVALGGFPFFVLFPRGRALSRLAEALAEHMKGSPPRLHEGHFRIAKCTSMRFNSKNLLFRLIIAHEPFRFVR